MAEAIEENPSRLLRSLLAYEHPDRERFEARIARCAAADDFSCVETPYAAIFLRYLQYNFPDGLGFIQEKLRGKVLLDLGEGSSDRCMEQLADAASASLYLSVDRHVQFADDEWLDSYRAIPDPEERNNIHAMHLQADMLDTLSRMPSGSASITINGIDRLVIQDLDYHRLLAQEMARVCAEDGIIFGTRSQALQELLTETSLHRQPLNDDPARISDSFLYEKTGSTTRLRRSFHRDTRAVFN